MYIESNHQTKYSIYLEMSSGVNKHIISFKKFQDAIERYESECELYPNKILILKEENSILLRKQHGG